MTKKAMSIEIMISLVIFILGFAIIILFLTYKYAPAAEGSTNEAVIKSWVLETSHLKSLEKLIGELSSYPPIGTLLKEPIEINSKKDLTNKQELIANTILNCFEAFDKGETDFLEPFDIYNSEPFCFQCAEINLNKELKGQSLAFLKEYINKQSPILTGKKDTYDSLLKGQYSIPSTIETDKLYLFFTASTNTLWERYKNSNIFLYYKFEILEPTSPIKAKVILDGKDKISQFCSPPPEQLEPGTYTDITKEPLFPPGSTPP